jgi:O-antigen ligase
MPILFKTLIAIEFLMVIGLGLFRYALLPQYRGTVATSTVVLALLTPVVALFCGNLYLFCGYLVLAIAFNSRSRAELAANFVFLLPLMPALSQETAVGSVYLFAISAVMAMSLGALIGFLVTSGRKHYAQVRIDISVIALIGIFVFIYNRDLSFTVFIRSLITNIVGFVGPYVIISRGMCNRGDIEILLLRLSMGGLITAIVAIFQARKHWVLFQTYYEALHVLIPFGTTTLSMRAGLLRTGGSMVDYSAAGVFLAVVLSLMPMLKTRFRPAGYWAVMILLVGGLFATQSRGGWIAAIIGILFICAYRRQWGRTILLIASGVAAEAVVLLFAKSGTLANIAGKTDEATSTVSYRKLLATRGFDQILAHPLFGQSPQQLVNNLPDLVQGQHIVDFVNSHLFIAMAAGVPLFLVWCYIWLAPVFEAWRHPSRGSVNGDLVEVPIAMIVPVMIAITATSIIDRNLNWPTIALALAGPCFALARQSAIAKSPKRVPLVRSIVPVHRSATVGA